MANSRTLAELELVLAVSRAAEEKFFMESIMPQISWIRGGAPNTIKVADTFRERFEKPKYDAEKGIVGHGSTHDYLLAYPEAAEEYKAAEDKEIRNERKKATILDAPEKANKRNPFLRHRRKLVADQLRALRDEPQGKFGPGRQAAKYEILRMLNKRNLNTHNPLRTLADRVREIPDLIESKAQDYYYGQGDPDWYATDEGKADAARYKALPQEEKDRLDRKAQKEAGEYGEKYGREKQEYFEKGVLGQKSQITPFRLRRMTDDDLDYLLKTNFKDPRIAALLLDEKRQRISDAFNRNQTRRGMLKRTAVQAVKPTLGSAPSSGGDKVAKTMLRLLSRGRIK